MSGKCHVRKKAYLDQTHALFETRAGYHCTVCVCVHARALGAGDQPGSCPRPLGPGRPSRDGSNRGSPHLSQINGRKGHPSVRSQVSPHGSVPGLGVGKTRRTRSRRSTKPRPPRAPRVALPQTSSRTNHRANSVVQPPRGLGGPQPFSPGTLLARQRRRARSWG